MGAQQRNGGRRHGDFNVIPFLPIKNGCRIFAQASLFDINQMLKQAHRALLTILSTQNVQKCTSGAYSLFISLSGWTRAVENPDLPGETADYGRTAIFLLMVKKSL
jgi:hypothetical protein